MINSSSLWEWKSSPLTWPLRVSDNLWLNCPQLYNGGTSSIYLRGLLCGLSEIMCIKYLKQCLAHKYYMCYLLLILLILTH